MYEHCGQREVKEHFDSFCEDFNTATMPSKKYYDLHAWHAAEQAKGRKKKARRAKEGGRARTRGARSGSRACTLTSLPHLATRLALTPPHPPPPRQVKTVERTTFDDEAERQSEIARGRAERQETVVKVTAPSRPNPPLPTLTHLPKPRP